MAAALTTKGDGGAKALPGHYELGITPGLGGEQPDLLTADEHDLCIVQACYTHSAQRQL